MLTLKEDKLQRPSWLVQRVPHGDNLHFVQGLLGNLELNTVCKSANCPNIGECYNAGTATFLILGGVCTRRCRFCAVPKGQPHTLDPDEPRRLAKAVKQLGLKHAVITSVTRDDLADGGAGQFAECIKLIRQTTPNTSIEVLVPDFNGNEKSLQIVLNEKPEVFNHNVETVPRLYEQVRPGADYKRSLQVLANAGKVGQSIVKSGIMVGLGETRQEVLDVFADLRKLGATSVTVGQYLSPSPEHLPVVEYIHPDQFKIYEQEAFNMGFKFVASGPLVRSSYHAADYIKENPSCCGGKI